MAKYNQYGQWILDGEEKPSRPNTSLSKKGADLVQTWEEQAVQEILKGFAQDLVRQPTDEELFGKLVKSEEEILAAKKEAEQRFEKTLSFYNKWRPANRIKKHNFNQESWGNGRPILDNITSEETRKITSD